MKINSLRHIALSIVALLFFVISGPSAAGQGGSATATPQGPSANPTPRPSPRRRGEGHPLKRREAARASSSRSISVLIISNLPNCNVTINGEPEDSTDKEGGLELLQIGRAHV